jgi:hypothetical protein
VAGDDRKQRPRPEAPAPKSGVEEEGRDREDELWRAIQRLGEERIRGGLLVAAVAGEGRCEEEVPK